jgi:predicted SAM-dependent methyltransferase
MLSRRAKATFFLLAGPIMKVNGWFYRTARTPRSGMVRAHLGPGQHRYLPGWINVDANMFTARCDVWADLRNGLPFPYNSVDAIYSYHVIEHLPEIDIHWKEVFRCLKPGGVFRVGGPNGDNAIKKFTEGDMAWFDDFPVKRRSVGGRFENFLLCRGEHLTILTASFLRELAEDAGFMDIEVRRPIAETGFPWAFGPEVLATEWEKDAQCPHTIVVEGRKPSTQGPRKDAN